MFQFEQLDVSHRTIEFADRASKIPQPFPADERFELTSQMRRAAEPVSSNMAAGTIRASNQDCVRFVEPANDSLMKVVSQARIATMQPFLSDRSRNEMEEAAQVAARKASGLRNSLVK